MSSQPRLLFLGPLPEPMTGQAIACQVLLDHLRQSYEVDVVNLSRSQLAGGGMETWRRIREVFGLARVILSKARKADLVYFTIVESLGGNLKDLLFFAAIGDRIERTVVHLHGGAGMREIMRGRYFPLAKLNRLALQRIAAMIVLGPRLVDIYEGTIPANRIQVAANFAEDELFASDEAILAKFTAPGPLRLLFLSNLIPGKGHLELLEAFQGLDSEARQGLILEFAGSFDNPGNETTFRERIADTPNIHYRGPLRGEAKRQAFANAHVFCLPTYYPYEGQPISILEAYASGCAVITTDHSGIFDIFADATNGLAVEKGSVESLRSALRAVALDKRALLPYGQTNARQARDRYRQQHFSERVGDIIASAVG